MRPYIVTNLAAWQNITECHPMQTAFKEMLSIASGVSTPVRDKQHALNMSPALLTEQNKINRIIFIIIIFTYQEVF